MIAPGSIQLEQVYRQPPAALWRALTEPDLHAGWWAAGDIRPVVGHRFTLDMGPFGKQACEMLEVEPERLLRYRFAAGTLDTVITWRLAPEGAGTRLALLHDGFNLGSAMGRAAFEGMKPGWPRLLERLGASLGG